MNAETIRRLNTLNRDFYTAIADDFDATRAGVWSGWDPLLPLLKPPFSVLDVGCGNGRFGMFLRRHFGAEVDYLGIDSNPALLDHARESLPEANHQFEQRDIVEQPPEIGSYDLVVMLGVIHHVPGAEQRLKLMQTLAQCVAAGGYFAFACWRFYEYARFRQRIAPTPPDLELEPNDYLLDWRSGMPALRYCHYVDDVELAQLVAATGMKPVMQYRSDGHSRDMNLYTVLRAE